MSFFLRVKPVFFIGYEFCVFFVQNLSTTFAFYFNVVSDFYIFNYCFSHFQIYKQLKIKNKNPNPNDQINTPIKFKHARIIHLSWSVVEFRNVVFVFGNQTIFFILLAVYVIKTISIYIYFLQFQVNFYFFIWQIQFLICAYILNDTHSKFCLDLELQVVFQDKLRLDSRRNFGVDRLIGHCLSCLAWVGIIISHRLGSLNLDENSLHL